MASRKIVLSTLVAMAAALFVTGCKSTPPSLINERLSEQSIGSATIGKKPGAKDRAHDYMMRR